MLHQLVHEPRDELDRGDRLGIRHTRWSEDADYTDGAADPPVRCQDERDVLNLERSVLVADVDLDAAGSSYALDERTEVAPVLQGGEDLPDLLAAVELRSSHDVEKAIAAEIVDQGRVELAHRPHQPLSDAAEQLQVVGLALAPRKIAQGSVYLIGSALDGQHVKQSRSSVQLVLVRGVGQVLEGLLHRPFAEENNQQRQAILDADEVNAPNACRLRLGEVGRARGAGVGGQRARGEAEPWFAREFHLAELVTDHALLYLRNGPLVGQDLDVVAIARVRGYTPGRGVRMREKAHRLEVGQDVANGRTAEIGRAS